ncbi:MAG: CaiB/BaiF CoA transferase family protein [Pseudomonadota bacterium]
MLKLLEGVRVVEAGHILLGPLAGQALGDFGADVIKLESLDGDTYRGLGQPRTPGGMTAQWMNNNRNKRSVALDLKDPEARAAAHEILRKADIFVHNMRPAALARLGLDYDTLRALNPRLVYCQATGFGSSGPYAGRAAVDDVAQAYSGFAALNGLHRGAPDLVPATICDIICGNMLAQTALAGLLRARETGEGCFIETPMFESAAAAVLNQHLNGHAFRPPVADLGYARVVSPHRRPVATKDGYIVHTIYNFRHWTRFLEATGRHDVLESPLMADRYAAAAHVGELYRIAAEEILPGRTTQEWLDLLGELDIPCAPVLSLEELETDPHLTAVGLLRDYDHPSQGPARDLRPPYETRDLETGDDRAPPELGQHTEEVLREAGLTEEAARALIARGAAGAWAAE